MVRLNPSKSERSATRIPLNRTKTVLDSLATHPIHPSFHQPRILANTSELLKTRQEHRARLAQRVPGESGRSGSAFPLNITQNTLAQLGAFTVHAGTSNSGQDKPSTGLSASTSTLQLRTMPTPPHPLPLSTARPSTNSDHLKTRQGYQARVVRHTPANQDAAKPASPSIAPKPL